MIFLPKTKSPRKKMKNSKLFITWKELADIFHLVIFITLLFSSFTSNLFIKYFPLLFKVCVSILSLPTEFYISIDISIITGWIMKWITSHENLRWDRIHHINIFFLEVYFGLENSKVTLDHVYHCKFIEKFHSSTD